MVMFVVVAAAVVLAMILIFVFQLLKFNDYLKSKMAYEKTYFLSNIV